jgi:transposase
MTDRAPSGPASFCGHDRRRLATALRRSSDARLFRRVQAGRRVAAGDPMRAVARSLRVSRRGVQRWVERYWCRRYPEDMLAARRSGRPRATDDLTQAALAELLAQDPRALGYRAPLGARRCWPHASSKSAAVRYRSTRCAAACRRTAGGGSARALSFVNEKQRSGRTKGQPPTMEEKAARRCDSVYRWDLAAAVSAAAGRLVAGG